MNFDPELAKTGQLPTLDVALMDEMTDLSAVMPKGIVAYNQFKWGILREPGTNQEMMVCHINKDYGAPVHAKLLAKAIGELIGSNKVQVYISDESYIQFPLTEMNNFVDSLPSDESKRNLEILSRKQKVCTANEFAYAFDVELTPIGLLQYATGNQVKWSILNSNGKGRPDLCVCNTTAENTQLVNKKEAFAQLREVFGTVSPMPLNYQMPCIPLETVALWMCSHPKQVPSLEAAFAIKKRENGRDFKR